MDNKRKQSIDALFNTPTGLPNDLINAFLHINPDYGLTPVDPVPTFAAYIAETYPDADEQKYFMQRSDSLSIKAYDDNANRFNDRLDLINEGKGAGVQKYCFGRFTQILYGNDSIN